MAAKKLQDYVRGKINNTNVPVHFSSSLETKIKYDVRGSNEISDNRERSTSVIDDFEEFSTVSETLDGGILLPSNITDNTKIPSSTSSSPGMKPKWGSNMTEIKKNFNTAAEDTYATINNLLKDASKDKSNAGDNNPTSEGSSENLQMRPSNTMPNMERIFIEHDGLKAAEKISKFGDNAVNENDPTEYARSVNIEHIQSKGKLEENDYGKSYLPCKVREDLIQNFENPIISLDNQSSLLSKFTIKNITIISIVLLSILLYDLYFLLIFTFGAFACLMTLLYFQVVRFSGLDKMFRIKRLNELKSPQIPYIVEKDMEGFDIHSTNASVYSGWINMIKSYDVDTYNINQCHTVHVDIEEGKIRFRKSKKKIPRRSLWNKSLYSVTFIGELVIDLDQVKIGLQPLGLVHKRLWSKKYPIELILPKTVGEYQMDNSFKDILDRKNTCIYLFGRTCREKEEWFRRICYALSNNTVELSMWKIVLQYLTVPTTCQSGSHSTEYSAKRLSGSNTGSSTKFFTEDEKKIMFNKTDEDTEELYIESKGGRKLPNIAEYVRFMAKFMPTDMFLMTSKVMQLDINFISCSDDLLSVNAFLARLFWDFMRGTHWAEVIRNKIQCKLKKIHLPQFMDMLKAVDLHLGQELPVIRKLWRPYLDSGGLWIHADIVYCGGVSMILETKVNLFNLRNLAKKNVDHVSEESLDTNKGEGERPKCHSSGGITDRSAAFLSSEEDSADSSTDSDDSSDEKLDNIWLDSGGGSSSGAGSGNPLLNGAKSDGGLISATLGNLTAATTFSAYSPSTERGGTGGIGGNSNQQHAVPTGIASSVGASGTLGSTVAPSTTLPTALASSTTPSTTGAATALSPSSSAISADPVSNAPSKRFIRWVDKIARNPYFLKAADNKYVQRGMEFVSNTKLMLQVEVLAVRGTLAINIPPPPSDRLWYGFRPVPVIEMSAKPKVGQKEISFTKISEFIEKKLISEFEKVLVLPNMDDVPLPLLINGSMDNYMNNL